MKEGNSRSVIRENPSGFEKICIRLGSNYKRRNECGGGCESGLEKTGKKSARRMGL